MEEDIKRCEELIKEEHANWIGISNQKAIENLIKGYRRLELENQALENTKNTCPNMATSGIRCDAKEKLKELEKKDNFYKDLEQKYFEVSKQLTDLNAEYFKLKQDSISKSKVKEKIEEYTNSILENLDEDRRWCDIELVDNFERLKKDLLED